MSRRDDIGLVEAAYDLEGDWSAWLLRLSEVALRRFPFDRGLVAVRWWVDADGRVHGDPVFLDVPGGFERVFEEHRRLVEENGIIAMALDKPFAGLRETFPPGHSFREGTLGQVRPFGVSDILKISAHDTPARMVNLSPLHSAPLAFDEGVRARYARIAGHLAAGLRLRSALEAGAPLRSEAIFESNGRTQRAEPQASGALESLRKAVVDRERARSNLRERDADAALGLWRGMVDGRWSLVDRFESDGEGRRFVVAVANVHDTPDPRALTPKEELVAQLVGCGRSNKEIAHQVGVSENTVATHVSSAFTKLGCENRADLIRWLQAENVEFTLDVDGVQIGVLAEPESSPPPVVGDLSPAEKDVLELIRRGQSNKAIALARGTSQRTVANQVAAILKKTGALSRYELMSAR